MPYTCALNHSQLLSSIYTYVCSRIKIAIFLETRAMDSTDEKADFYRYWNLTNLHKISAEASKATKAQGEIK